LKREARPVVPAALDSPATLGNLAAGERWLFRGVRQPENQRECLRVLVSREVHLQRSTGLQNGCNFVAGLSPDRTVRKMLKTFR
jgi:hypothetical protein